MNGDFIQPQPQPQQQPQYQAPVDDTPAVITSPQITPAAPAKKRGFLKTLIMILLLAAVAGGVYFWQQKKIDDLNHKVNTLNAETASLTSQLAAANSTKSPAAQDETAAWKEVVSKQQAFSIKIPDGWKVNNYAKSDRISAATAADLNYQKGTPATIADIAAPYAGDSQFALVATIGDSATMAKPEGTESTFTPGAVPGKKYTQVYAADTSAGVGARKKGDKKYEYRFTLNGGKVFNLVYNVNSGETDNVELVEKVIQTVKLAQ
jgi:outer membrane murein-binding lipoprotein Lpp